VSRSRARAPPSAPRPRARPLRQEVLRRAPCPSSRSANATSGSIIQNSVRWPPRLRLLGAERRPEAIDLARMPSPSLHVELPLCVRYALSSK
jgi:hypothetical protein